MFLDEWDKRFASDEEMDVKLHYWAEKLKHFDDKVIKSVLNQILDSGMKQPPLLPEFRKLCQAECEKNELRQPLYVSGQNRVKSNLKQEMAKFKQDLKLPKKDTRTKEEIEAHEKAEKTKIIKLLAEMEAVNV
jgi:hypothetical protein